MTVQFVEVSGKRMALLPAEEFERLLADAEEHQEIADAEAAARARAEGCGYLPAEMANRILDGESALRVWRQHRGLSAAALAALVGVGPSHITHLENGTREGRLTLWRAIADVLHVHIDDIVPVG